MKTPPVEPSQHASLLVWEDVVRCSTGFVHSFGIVVVPESKQKKQRGGTILELYCAMYVEHWYKLNAGRLSSDVLDFAREKKRHKKILSLPRRKKRTHRTGHHVDSLTHQGSHFGSQRSFG